MHNAFRGPSHDRDISVKIDPEHDAAKHNRYSANPGPKLKYYIRQIEYNCRNRYRAERAKQYLEVRFPYRPATSGTRLRYPAQCSNKSLIELVTAPWACARHLTIPTQVSGTLCSDPGRHQQRYARHCQVAPTPGSQHFFHYRRYASNRFSSNECISMKLLVARTAWLNVRRLRGNVFWLYPEIA